jgi:hypothetical protein
MSTDMRLHGAESVNRRSEQISHTTEHIASGLEFLTNIDAAH